MHCLKMASTNTVCLENNNITRIIKIKNFSKLTPDDKITDQDISYKCTFVKLLQIRVYPAKVRQNIAYVSVMIRRRWIPEYPLSYHCTVSIIDEFGNLRLPASFGHRSQGERSVKDVGLEEYISRLEVLNDTSGLLMNDTLTLQCEVSYTIESAKEPTAESLWNMLNLLCEMFPQKDEAPKKVERWTFLIETNEGDTFPLKFEKGRKTLGSEVVKASKVIQKMVESPMAERTEKKVVLKDVDCGTLSHFLSYVERKRLIINSVEEACNLYEMADKYEVMNLMQDCGSYLAFNLDSENMVEISSLAAIHNDDVLFKECRNYIRQNMNMENVQELFYLAKQHPYLGLQPLVAEFVIKNRDLLLQKGQTDLVHFIDDKWNKQIEVLSVTERKPNDETEPDTLDKVEPLISGQYEFYGL